MYADAALRGFKVDIIPHALYTYRLIPDESGAPNGVYSPAYVRSSRLRALRPYLDHLDVAERNRLLNVTLSTGTESVSLFPLLRDEDDKPVTRLW